jgi:hypothetical protein
MFLKVDVLNKFINIPLNYKCRNRTKLHFKPFSLLFEFKGNFFQCHVQLFVFSKKSEFVKVS